MKTLNKEFFLTVHTPLIFFFLLIFSTLELGSERPTRPDRRKLLLLQVFNTKAYVELHSCPLNPVPHQHPYSKSISLSISTTLFHYQTSITAKIKKGP